MHQPITRKQFSRRAFLRAFATVGLTMAGTATYARTLEPRWLDVTSRTLAIPGLTPTLDGFRIAQLSDIHFSKYIGPEHLAWALRQVQSAEADVLVLTGDYVGDDAQTAENLVEPLAAFDRPVYAVYGNHDLWTHRPTIRRYLELSGAQVLTNTARELANGLWLAGIDDVWSGRPSLTAALNGIPARASTILLAHEPDFFDQVLAQNAPIVAQLSGHSHGGQIRLPTLEPDPAGDYSYAPILPRLGRRYPIGLRTIDGRTIYTNRGLGVWPIPFRLNCRPEVTIFTLVAA